MIPASISVDISDFDIRQSHRRKHEKTPETFGGLSMLKPQNHM